MKTYYNGKMVRAHDAYMERKGLLESNGILTDEVVNLTAELARAQSLQELDNDLSTQNSGLRQDLYDRDQKIYDLEALLEECSHALLFSRCNANELIKIQEAKVKEFLRVSNEGIELLEYYRKNVKDSNDLGDRLDEM